MSVLCGWAASSEWNSINGRKGDQKSGNEVKLGAWYAFGQNVILRCKDRSKAKKMASHMKAICQNNHVGYGQSDRLTLYYAWKSVGWNNPSKIVTDCNTDCSQLVSTCCIAVGYNIQPTNWTGSLRTALLGTGQFEALTDAKFLNGSDYLLTGDIILNEKSHVIMALEDGPKASQSAKKSSKKMSIEEVAKSVIRGEWGVGDARAKALKAAGYDAKKVQAKVDEILKAKKKATLKTGKVVAQIGLNVRNKPSTTQGVIVKVLPYGTKVTCYGVARGDGRNWWKISKSKNEYVASAWIK